MLTPRGLTLLVGAALVVAVGRLLGIGELLVIAAAAAALVGLSVLAVRFASTTVSVERSVSAPRLAHGATAQVSLALHNQSRLPAALLLLEDRCPSALASPPRFVVPGLPPDGTRVLRYPVAGRVRGRYALGPATVRVRDPFGLAERARSTSATTEVLVHPRVEALTEGGPRGSDRGQGASRTRRLLSEGDEFYTMREYVRGDDLRRVHWPSTARRQTLMVRQQELAWQARATVFCDGRGTAHEGGGPSSTLERAVSVAASVLVGLADRGYAVRLATEETARPPSPERVEVLLDRLAALRPSRHRGLAAAFERLQGSGGEGLLVAVLGPSSSTNDAFSARDLRALRVAGRAYGGRIALIVVDPSRRVSATRADALARSLNASGWRATTVAIDQPLSTAWRGLRASQAPAAVAAPAGAPGGSSGNVAGGNR